MTEAESGEWATVLRTQDFDLAGIDVVVTTHLRFDTSLPTVSTRGCDPQAEGAPC